MVHAPRPGLSRTVAIAQRSLALPLLQQCPPPPCFLLPASCEMNPYSRGHPLGVAVGDEAAAAVGVLVPEDAVDHVGDGLEAAVRVPGGALGLAGA
jgi:hypothetical protein